MKKRTILQKKFFNRPAPIVAKELIGKFLVRKIGSKEIKMMITETEAYHGAHDLACHGRHGKTKRNEILFGEAGKFYIFMIYGMYSMLNVVTGEEEFPSGVLIRAVEGAKGPGRLTRTLKISQTFNGLAAGRKSNLWFEDEGMIISPRLIKSTPRIGVEYAGPIWSKKKYRFVLEKKN